VKTRGREGRGKARQLRKQHSKTAQTKYDGEKKNVIMETERGTN
jgi:ribosomal protein L25 (general stress protein Ctc)